MKFGFGSCVSGSGFYRRDALGTGFGLSVFWLDVRIVGEVARVDPVEHAAKLDLT
jgi:hypothetical protein